MEHSNERIEELIDTSRHIATELRELVREQRDANGKLYAFLRSFEDKTDFIDEEIRRIVASPTEDTKEMEELKKLQMSANGKLYTFLREYEKTVNRIEKQNRKINRIVQLQRNELTWFIENEADVVSGAQKPLLLTGNTNVMIKR